MESFDKTIKKLDLFEKHIRFDNFVFDDMSAILYGIVKNYDDEYFEWYYKYYKAKTPQKLLEKIYRKIKQLIRESELYWHGKPKRCYLKH